MRTVPLNWPAMSGAPPMMTGQLASERHCVSPGPMDSQVWSQPKAYTRPARVAPPHSCRAVIMLGPSVMAPVFTSKIHSCTLSRGLYRRAPPRMVGKERACQLAERCGCQNRIKYYRIIGALAWRCVERSFGTPLWLWQPPNMNSFEPRAAIPENAIGVGVLAAISHASLLSFLAGSKRHTSSNMCVAPGYPRHHKAPPHTYMTPSITAAAMSWLAAVVAAESGTMMQVDDVTLTPLGASQKQEDGLEQPHNAPHGKSPGKVRHPPGTGAAGVFKRTVPSALTATWQKKCRLPGIHVG